MNKKKLIFIELNELNFDIVKKYVNSEKLNNLKKIIEGNFIETESESEYKLIEPWIQWVTIHTGLTANEHKVFRLGDIVNKDLPQIFEEIEKKGYEVGAIMPMNTSNRLKNPKFFIPDAWTQTKTDGSFWSNLLHNSLSKIVNDNSKKQFSILSLFLLLICFLKFSKIKNYFLYLGLIFKGIKYKYNLAIFLDLFLHDVHLTLFQKHKPNFSSIFFNASAHIQHHYFFNTKYDNDSMQKNPDWYLSDKKDPFLEVLRLYDKIIGDYLNLKEYNLIITTGFSQKKYDRVKFYYRLKKHNIFLNKLGIKFKETFPRMTRDFLVTFENEREASIAENILLSVKSIDNESIFTEIENRGTSLFVVLGYPKEITNNFIIISNGKKLNFYNEVAFVGLKNGMHNSKGFIYLDNSFEKKYNDGFNIKLIHGIILDYFDKKSFN